MCSGVGQFSVESQTASDPIIRTVVVVVAADSTYLRATAAPVTSDMSDLRRAGTVVLSTLT